MNEYDDFAYPCEGCGNYFDELDLEVYDGLDLCPDCLFGEEYDRRMVDIDFGEE